MNTIERRRTQSGERVLKREAFDDNPSVCIGADLWLTGIVPYQASRNPGGSWAGRVSRGTSIVATGYEE